MTKIIAIGEIVWDCLPAGKQLGGAPLNFAFFAKELGAQAYAVSAVGVDELGDETLQVASATGVNLDFVQRNDLPTSRVLVTLDDKGIPQYEIVEGVAWDAIECPDSALELVSQGRARSSRSSEGRGITKEQPLKRVAVLVRYCWSRLLHTLAV